MINIINETELKNDNGMVDYGLVSVIVPSYKRHKNIVERALRSLLVQSYSNIEIILVDDNADENLIEYRKELQNLVEILSDTRIVYISNEKNLGAAQSKNKGVSIAKGEYITFLDDDDIYQAYKIEKQLSAMAQNKANVSVCNMILVNEKGKVVDKRKRRYLKRKDSLIVKHLKYHITGTDTMMFQKNFFEKIGGFDAQDLGDEFYLMFKALKNNPVFLHVDYDGVEAVVHNQTGLSSGDNKIITEKLLFEFKKKQFQILKKKDVRYIKMRHYSVIAVAHKKNKRFFACIGALIKAFFCDCVGMCRLYFGMDR